MCAALDYTGNPSSVHAEGRAARQIVEQARETIAALFGVRPSGVYFTSGGTEAANWLLAAARKRGTRLSAVEHRCVLKGHRFEPGLFSTVPVSNDGVLDLAAFEEALTIDALAAVQAANNETGVMQPLDAIAQITRAKGRALVCDAVQAAGRIPLQYLEEADALSFSAHKFGGPKGVGAVLVRDSAFPPPRSFGEADRSAGIVQARRTSRASPGWRRLSKRRLRSKAGSQRAPRRCRQSWRAACERLLPKRPCSEHATNRLPNTTYFAIPGRSAEMSLIAFDLEGVAVSSRLSVLFGKGRAVACARRHGRRYAAWQRRYPRFHRLDHDGSGYRPAFNRS